MARRRTLGPRPQRAPRRPGSQRPRTSQRAERGFAQRRRASPGTDAGPRPLTRVRVSTITRDTPTADRRPRPGRDRLSFGTLEVQQRLAAGGAAARGASCGGPVPDTVRRSMLRTLRYRVSSCATRGRRWRPGRRSDLSGSGSGAGAAAARRVRVPTRGRRGSAGRVATARCRVARQLRAIFQGLVTASRRCSTASSWVRRHRLAANLLGAAPRC
jgi:hypothetical protein